MSLTPTTFTLYILYIAITVRTKAFIRALQVDYTLFMIIDVFIEMQM